MAFVGLFGAAQRLVPGLGAIKQAEGELNDNTYTLSRQAGLLPKSGRGYGSPGVGQANGKGGRKRRKRKVVKRTAVAKPITGQKKRKATKKGKRSTRKKSKAAVV